MVEIIVVAAILGLLATGMLVAVPKYFQRQRDIQRKSDLATYKIQLEEYYADNTCYPPAGDMQNCAGTNLRPYLKEVLCDPGTDQPYQYVLSNGCQQYELYTNLEDITDPDIAEIGCQNGCGPGNAYNYGVVGGGALIDN